MPVIQASIPSMPTLLKLVNTCLADMKQPPIQTLAGAKPLPLVIVAGINDAIIDLYTRAKWAFRSKTLILRLVAGQDLYNLPADFGSVERDIKAGTDMIRYMPPDVFLENTPLTGSPMCFTLVDGDTLQFSPVPNADFVASFPQLALVYDRRPVLVENDNDAPDLPMEFQDALKCKGRMAWKAAQEYSQADLQMEEGRYEAMIQKKLASYLKTPGSKRQGLKMNLSNTVRTPFRGF